MGLCVIHTRLCVAHTRLRVVHTGLLVTYMVALLVIMAIAPIIISLPIVCVTDLLALGTLLPALTLPAWMANKKGGLPMGKSAINL